MLKVRLSMGEIHYTESGEGPPLLLLHANPGDARDWEAVAPDLSKRFRVIALDWPGYGESPLLPDPETISTLWFYSVLVEFFEKMKFERVVLVGNSLGGMIAARFASEFPEKVGALVLVAPGGFTPHTPISRFRQVCGLALIFE